MAPISKWQNCWRTGEHSRCLKNGKRSLHPVTKRHGDWASTTATVFQVAAVCPRSLSGDSWTTGECHSLRKNSGCSLPPVWAGAPATIFQVATSRGGRGAPVPDVVGAWWQGGALESRENPAGIGGLAALMQMNVF